MSSLHRTVAAAATAAAIAGATAAPATAQTPPRSRTTVEVVSSREGTDFTDLLDSCKGSAGSRCAITDDFAVERTVELTSGLTRGTVAATLGISESPVATLSAECAAVHTRKDTVLKAYARGRFYSYTTVTTVDLHPYGSADVRTRSRVLTAFDPQEVACV